MRLKAGISEEEHRDMSESILTGGGEEAGEDGDDDENEGKLQDDSEMIDESLKSRSFKEFEDKCCLAYNILRRDGHQLINMFLIMLSAGMPELKRDDDIQFMVNRLDLSISE